MLVVWLTGLISLAPVQTAFVCLFKKLILESHLINEAAGKENLKVSLFGPLKFVTSSCDQCAVPGADTRYFLVACNAMYETK